MPEDDLAFDAATALATMMSELIVELVRSGALRRTQALKILLRAESITDALRFQKDPEDSLSRHETRLALRRLTVGSVVESVERRLGVRPEIHALRHRRRRVADAIRRRSRA
jgi:hypothetical protein